MRVPVSTSLALAALVALGDAGLTIDEPPYCGYYYSDKCDCNIACITSESYAPCSPTDAAEFALVAPLLQQCEDASATFNRGRWGGGDPERLCDLQSPCGMLVPYIVNTKPYNRLCAPYEKYKYVLATFHGFCRHFAVIDLPGDNGLLAALKQKSPSGPPTTTPKATTNALPSTTVVGPTPPSTTPTTTAPSTPPTTMSTPAASVDVANTTTAAPTPTTDESSSASASNEVTVVGPGAAANKTLAPVPSSSRPKALSSAARFVVATSAAATLSAVLPWVHG